MNEDNRQAPEPLTQATRDRLVEACDRSLRQSETGLHHIVRIRRKHLTQLGQPESLAIVVNGFELGMQAQFEMAVFLQDVVTADTNLRANLYARHLLLSLYEYTKTLRGVLDHKFRDAFAQLLDTDEYDETLRECHSKVHGVFSEADALYGAVRNSMAGHRDPDAEVRIRSIEQTRANEVCQLAGDVLAALIPLIDAQNALWESELRALSD